MARRIAGQRRGTGRRTESSEVTQATPDAPEVVSAPSSEAPEITESEQTEDVKPSETGRKNPAPGGRVPLVLSAVLAVLVVLILALGGILGIKALKGREAEDARGQAATAGRKAAETALSYDYRTLDKSFAAARATMTPDFAAKFDDTAKVAGELATKTKATVRADVREVGVRDGDADRVTLIIFVNQTTTSTITQGKPRVDLNRTRFTMVRNGDQWLVQEIAGL